MGYRNTPEYLRETGKSLFFGEGKDREERSRGLAMLIEAHMKNDPEATYVVAKLVLNNVIKSKKEGVDPEEHALELMHVSATRGCVQARGFLNSYCRSRYERTVASEKLDLGGVKTGLQGGIIGFDGNPIKIDRKGLFTPIDAELVCENNRNLLKLSVNIMFLYSDEIENRPLFEKAVKDGVYLWQGEYKVFGGQPLTVEVSVTDEERLFDNVYILPVTESMEKTALDINRAVGGKEREKRFEEIMNDKRSFAISGLKWSVKSRKYIYIQSESGAFDEYEEIKHVTKHEFGHALGLGDLYASASDGYAGVEKGTFDELDSYYIGNKTYNLVMCDHHAPVSDNDIEMVLLAFSENKMQSFQSDKFTKEVSEALGKGN